MTATRTITIGEMIPDAASPEIEQLIKDGKVTAKDFLPVLKKYEKEMLAKEILPEYAAYCIEYAITQTSK